MYKQNSYSHDNNKVYEPSKLSNQGSTINVSPISNNENNENLKNGRFFGFGSFDIGPPIIFENNNNNKLLRTGNGTPLATDEARYNLATRIMSNGVEVIVAGDKNSKPTHKHNVLRIAPSNLYKPMTLAPSTLKDQMIMIGPSNLEDNFTIPINPHHFVTKTCLTTYTYRTTYLQDGTTTVESREKVISNIATEERNYLKITPTVSSGVTLTRTPELAIGVFHTSYTYYNTILDGELPLVVSSEHTVTNTITGPDDYISFLQPSDQATPILETNTYFSKITMTKTLLDNDIQKVVSTSNILTQVIVTESLPPRSTSVMTSYIAFDIDETSTAEKNNPNIKHDITSTDVLKTQYITYTYYNTIIDKDGSVQVQTNVSVSPDIVTEKLYLYTKKDGSENTDRILSSIKGSERTKPIISQPTDIKAQISTTDALHIYATKTYLTTFTYFTTLLKNSADAVSSTVIDSHTRVIENVITESVPSYLLNSGLISKFRRELFKSKAKNAIVTMATLLGGQTLEITAMNMLKPSAVSKTKNDYKQQTNLPQTALTSSLPVVLPSVDSNSAIEDSEIADSEIDEVIYSQHILEPIKQSNVKNKDDKNKRNPNQNYHKNSTKVNNSGGINEFPMKNIINSFNLNGLQALGPVFNAMAGLISNNFGTKTNIPQLKRNQSRPLIESTSPITYILSPESKHLIKNISAYDGIENHYGPIYIPVQDIAGVPNNVVVDALHSPNHGSPQSLHISPPDKWLTDEKMNRDNKHDFTLSSSVAASKPTFETPLLNGGISISPGEVITANSDVIVGKPSGIRPRVPFNNKLNDVDTEAQQQTAAAQNPIPNIIPVGQYQNDIDTSIDSILRPPPLQTIPQQQQIPFQLHRQNLKHSKPTNFHMQYAPKHPHSNQLLPMSSIRVPFRNTNNNIYNNNNNNNNGDKFSQINYGSQSNILNQNLPQYPPQTYSKYSYSQNTLPIFKPNGAETLLNQGLQNNEIIEIKRIPEIFSTDLPPTPEVLNLNTQIPGIKQHLLVDIKPSQVANIVIPYDKTSSMVVFEGFGDSNGEPHKNGQYFDEPAPYPNTIIDGSHTGTLNGDHLHRPSVSASPKPSQIYHSNQQVNLDTNVLSHNVDVNVPPITFKKDADFPQSTPVRGQIHKNGPPFHMPHVKIPITDDEIHVNLTPQNVILPNSYLEEAGPSSDNSETKKDTINIHLNTYENFDSQRLTNNNNNKNKNIDSFYYRNESLQNASNNHVQFHGLPPQIPPSIHSLSSSGVQNSNQNRPNLLSYHRYPSDGSFGVKKKPVSRPVSSGSIQTPNGYFGDNKRRPIAHITPIESPFDFNRIKMPGQYKPPRPLKPIFQDNPPAYAQRQRPQMSPSTIQQQQQQQQQQQHQYIQLQSTNIPFLSGVGQQFLQNHNNQPPTSYYTQPTQYPTRQEDRRPGFSSIPISENLFNSEGYEASRDSEQHNNYNNNNINEIPIDYLQAPSLTDPIRDDHRDDDYENEEGEVVQESNSLPVIPGQYFGQRTQIHSTTTTSGSQTQEEHNVKTTVTPITKLIETTTVASTISENAVSPLPPAIFADSFGKKYSELDQPSKMYPVQPYLDSSSVAEINDLRHKENLLDAQKTSSANGSPFPGRPFSAKPTKPTAPTQRPPNFGQVNPLDIYINPGEKFKKPASSGSNSIYGALDNLHAYVQMSLPIDMKTEQNEAQTINSKTQTETPFNPKYTQKPPKAQNSRPIEIENKKSSTVRPTIKTTTKSPHRFKSTTDYNMELNQLEVVTKSKYDIGTEKESSEIFDYRETVNPHNYGFINGERNNTQNDMVLDITTISPNIKQRPSSTLYPFVSKPSVNMKPPPLTQAPKTEQVMGLNPPPLPPQQPPTSMSPPSEVSSSLTPPMLIASTMYNTINAVSDGTKDESLLSNNNKQKETNATVPSLSTSTLHDNMSSNKRNSTTLSSVRYTTTIEPPTVERTTNNRNKNNNIRMPSITTSTTPHYIVFKPEITIETLDNRHMTHVQSNKKQHQMAVETLTTTPTPTDSSMPIRMSAVPTIIKNKTSTIELNVSNKGKDNEPTKISQIVLPKDEPIITPTPSIKEITGDAKDWTNNGNNRYQQQHMRPNKYVPNKTRLPIINNQQKDQIMFNQNQKIPDEILIQSSEEISQNAKPPAVLISSNGTQTIVMHSNNGKKSNRRPSNHHQIHRPLSIVTTKTRISSRIILPTKYITNTKTLTVTTTKTTVLTSQGIPSTQTFTLTKTSTILDTITETHTHLLKPTKASEFPLNIQTHISTVYTLPDLQNYPKFPEDDVSNHHHHHHNVDNANLDDLDAFYDAGSDETNLDELIFYDDTHDDNNDNQNTENYDNNNNNEDEDEDEDNKSTEIVSTTIANRQFTSRPKIILIPKENNNNNNRKTSTTTTTKLTTPLLPFKNHKIGTIRPIARVPIDNDMVKLNAKTKSKLSNFENESIFVVMSDKKNPNGVININSSLMETPQNINNAIGSPSGTDNANENNSIDYDESISFDLPTRDEQQTNNEANHVLLGGILIATPPKASDNAKLSSYECRPDCKASRNELCQRIDSRMRCVCRPGFARMFPDRPCKPTYTYSLELPIYRIGKEVIKFNENMRNKESDEFLQLAGFTHDALDRMVMQSDFRDVYHGVHVSAFEKSDHDSSIVGSFLLQLSDNSDENRLVDVFKKYLRGNNFSIGGTELFSTRSGVDSLHVADFDECRYTEFHDCSENAHCFNLHGTYTCSCREGFADLSINPVYPGRICSAELIGCEKCHYHGTCYTPEENSQPICECFHWYTGASCQLNLKILLIALIAIGTILFILLLFCLLVTCTKRRKTRNMQTLMAGINIIAPKHSRLSGGTMKIDKRAMIKDSSSEASINSDSLPYVAKKESKKLSVISGGQSHHSAASHLAHHHHHHHHQQQQHQQQQQNMSQHHQQQQQQQQQHQQQQRNMRGHPPHISPPMIPSQAEIEHRCNFLDQNDRSLTVMIPRAKYHPVIHQALQQHDNIEHSLSGIGSNNGACGTNSSGGVGGGIGVAGTSSSGGGGANGGASGGGIGSSASNSETAKLLCYLDSGNQNLTPSKKLSGISLKHGALHTMTTGALVSAGFEVSATVGAGAISNLSTMESKSHMAGKLGNRLVASTDGQSSHYSGYKKGDGHGTFIDTMDVWLEQNELTASEARSYDETTIQAPTKSLRSVYEKQLSQMNNDEANTMAERDIGSTFLLPHTHLYKPDRGSDASGFDSF